MIKNYWQQNSKLINRQKTKINYNKQTNNHMTKTKMIQ